MNRFEQITDAFAKLETLWTQSDLTERKKLIETARTKTTTNCSWDEYGAAQFILRRADFKL